MIYPRTLHAGGCIAIAAPAFPMGKERLEKCVKRLKDLGYRVKTGKNLAEGKNFHGYLCGSGRERAADLCSLFADPEVDAIICIRGGYGSAQMMKYLDYDLIRRNPKVFVGYSDITNLLNTFALKCGFVTYHGPMVSSNILENYDEYTQESFLKTIGDWEELEFVNDISRPAGGSSTGNDCGRTENSSQEENAGREEESRTPKTPVPFRTITGGRAEGRLIGGNVTVVGRMMGTFYQPDSRGKIIFLEDVDEHIASLDMYITQMENAGFFDEAAGILLGDYSGCINKYGEDYLIEKFLEDRFAPLGIPVLAGLQVGHSTPTGTLPIGAWCRLDADNKKITFVKK